VKESASAFQHRERTEMPQDEPRETHPEPVQLDGEESLVLEVLKAAKGAPMDVIEISNGARLSIERTLRALEFLAGHGLVRRVDPEPVHERFTPAGSIETLQRA
jgi:hypothetical protein